MNNKTKIEVHKEIINIRTGDRERHLVIKEINGFPSIYYKGYAKDFGNKIQTSQEIIDTCQ